MKSFNEFINDLKRNCLMVTIDDSIITGRIKELQQSIPADLIDPTEGLELYHHITVLYGFDPYLSFGKIQPFLPELVDGVLGKLSYFDNPKYQVLKVEVESPDLVQLNKELRERFEIVNDYPNYIPHLTIGYLKKPMKNLDINTFMGLPFETSSFTYS